MKQTVGIILIVNLLTGCVKDKPSKALSPVVNLSGKQKVYVVNEGPFNSGNGSISLYDPESNAALEDVYHDVNNSYIGNIVQFMTLINQNYYFVANNSGKIVYSNKSFERLGEINGLTSPRYILQISNQKAYVSDLYSDFISVLNLADNSIKGTIPCAGWTDRMALIYNKAFVTNLRRKYVYIINTINDQITDSVDVGINAAGIVIDKQDKVWVLSTGDKSNAIPGKLSRINPINLQVEFSLTFAANGSPGNLCLNRTKDTLYFLNDDVFRMAIAETNLPTVPFIVKGSKNFYGLGQNPNDYNVYVADALDYSQRSNIYIYSASGEQKTFFKAGVNANGFYFE